MITHIITSWKTTLIGLFAGLLFMFGTTMQAREIDPSTPPITLGNTLPAIGIALIGALAKDADKSNAQTPGPAQKVN